MVFWSLLDSNWWNYVKAILIEKKLVNWKISNTTKFSIIRNIPLISVSDLLGYSLKALSKELLLFR